ncbi:MAG: arylsulfatase [Bacteroidetes bacterium]|nr:MAG: arylsulfatase [Bacteroidota bacterium]
MKRIFPLFSLLGFLALSCGSGPSSDDKALRSNEKVAPDFKPPNIVFILADDLGYGDPSCYGQEKFTTPHLDQLAADGIRFTRHYAGSTVCAPSRSVLMTGLHTGHTPIRGNREVKPEGQAPLPASAFTIAEMLKEAGYVTGAFGKWGLGFPGSEGDPMKQGFDRFYGYNCQRYAHRYYPAYLWDNDQKVMLEGNDWTHRTSYAPDLIQKQVLDFIREYKDSSFFAYVPMVIPHAELVVPEDSILSSYMGRFPEEPYTGHPGADYGPGLRVPAYCSQSAPRATFSAMVRRLDQHVGEIVALLKELGIAENTLIMFSSDNGPHQEGGADPSFFNSSGNLRGLKRDLYEGGIRVPFLAAWPGTIEAGRSSAHVSAFWDLMPTLAELSSARVPATDGISFLPELLGQAQPEHEQLYWEFHEQGGKQAILKDGWKAVRLGVRDDPAAPVELYNLNSDPAEQHNLAAEHPVLADSLARLMDASRIPSETFRFGRNH